MLAARGIERISEFYLALGFTLTPKADHPFGTSNRLILFQDHFLEIVAITNPDKVVKHENDNFSFAAYINDYLLQYEGLSMIALKSEGWQRDRNQFLSQGLVLGAPFRFSRKAKQPRGSEVEVRFELTFIGESSEKGLKFFTCDHQHLKEEFYKREFQKHANTAFKLSEIILMSPDPSAHFEFFKKIGQNINVTKESGELTIDFGSARYRILSPRALRDKYFIKFSDENNNLIRGLGFRLSVKNLERVRKQLEVNKINFQEEDNVIRISPKQAFGSIIEFSR